MEAEGPFCSSVDREQPKRALHTHLQPKAQARQAPETHQPGDAKSHGSNFCLSLPGPGSHLRHRHTSESHPPPRLSSPHLTGRAAVPGGEPFSEG